MKTTENITLTNRRQLAPIKTIVDKAIEEKEIEKTIDKTVDASKSRTGVLTKFYPYLDKAEVKLDHNSKKVLCRFLHNFSGSLIDFFTPDGESSFCETLHEPCILPRADLHVCVLDISNEDAADEMLILGYFNPDDIVGIKPANPGYLKITDIGATNQWGVEIGQGEVNIRTVKGAHFTEGEYHTDDTDVEYANSEKVYTKQEMDDKLNNPTYLLDITQDYKQTDADAVYTLFRGDCWTINNNFEASASITSQSSTDFKVTGTFRTINDLIGIYWNSKDIIDHPYISYGERSNYTNVALDFDYEMTGAMDFSNNVISITIATNAGETYYVRMNRFITDGHFHLDFDHLTQLPGDTYINAAGETITVTEETPVPVNNIKFIMLVLVPTNYVENISQYTIMENADFNCEINNITVTNSTICKEHIDLEPHPYRLCEGYDDFYNLNPYRVCREMRKLGYVEWLDLYVGASHFYEKSGTPGDTINATVFNHTRTEKMVLNKNVPLNKAFIAWLDCYSRELLRNDCPNLVISVSMENLQCPTDWRQRDVNGNYALTGWVPSTFFYSPCHHEVAPFMQSVSQACLDIVVSNGLQPILQNGECWWWWNENDKPQQPPCFYDDSTKQKYLEETGHALPEYDTSHEKGYNRTMMQWLNQQLVQYSDKLREVVKSQRYDKGLYMALFFPPSVTDVDRVPKMMREVNYLKDAYSPNKLDVLQLEDYDWVIWESSHHEEVYTLGQELGFTEDRLHYFGGFVQYENDAIKYWRLIKESMEEALDKNFQEIYVWAGSQVRRDHKILGYDGYEFIQELL
ncbi:MAG: hypothetical protein IJF83_05895 [Methanobrevibacter sp.]|nr:hypothetical protein [Methanobrevibacter sp.]